MPRFAILALLLFMALLAGCERASELIPGGDDTATPGATPSDATPILTTPTLDFGSSTSTPTPAIPDHELARSVVQIHVIDTEASIVQIVRDGSGVVVDGADQLILTAYALVAPYTASGGRAYTTIAIGVNDGNGGAPRLVYEAELVAADRSVDLAVLKVTREYQGEPLAEGEFDLPAAESADASGMTPGDAVRLFAHPGLEVAAADAQALTVTSATVTGRRGEPDRDGTTRLKLDARLPYGATGGPAFDAGGALIGILVPEHYDASATVAQVRPLNLAGGVLADARGRPINEQFVVPLHAEEPAGGFDALIASDGVRVSRPLFAENATVNGSGFDLFDYERGFISGTPELYFEFVLEGTEAGALVEERWYLEGVLQDSLSSSYPWDGGGYAIVADRIGVASASGLPDGLWRLEIWVDGTMRSAAAAVVGTDPDAAAFSNPTFGALAGSGGRSLTGATAVDEQMLMFFDYAGMDVARRVRWFVFHDEQLVYQTGELLWPGGGAGRFWIGYSSDGALGAGTWRFQLVVDGQTALDVEQEIF
jgi:S1-C subfamily serine protease